MALGKALQRDREAEVAEERRAVISKEHGALARGFLSLHQVKSAQEPLVECCSVLLLREYIFHGPPASVTN